jgi:Tfp pilus assembly protein PilV
MRPATRTDNAERCIKAAAGRRTTLRRSSIATDPDAAKDTEPVMKQTLLASVALLVVFAANAEDSGLKPGLWEIHVIKQVVDGHDQSAQMAGMAEKMQQAMANMPPEQRARLEATMKDRFAANGAVRVCISPEMAKHNAPVIDKDGHCRPASQQRSGNHMSYEFSCETNGTLSTGKGESTVTGELVTSQMDLTMRGKDGKSHVTHSESEMRFVAADCGDVKPITPPK